MLKTHRNRRYELTASPFYRLPTRKKLAELLQVSPQALKLLAADNALYVRRWKHKTQPNRWSTTKPAEELAQDYRPIDIPAPHLKKVQSRIADLLARISPPDFLFSPVKGRSYVDNAVRHLGATAYRFLDIADYFPSCTANNVARFFGRDLQCPQDVTAVLVRLTTFDERLPQGSPSSPILAYFSNRPMWVEIDSLVREAGFTFSLYADDITISGPMVPEALIWEVKMCVHRHGLKTKPSKEGSLIARPAEITGVVVTGGRTKVPNRQLKRLAELKAERKSNDDPTCRRKLNQQIAGREAQRKQVEQPGPASLFAKNS